MVLTDSIPGVLLSHPGVIAVALPAVLFVIFILWRVRRKQQSAHAHAARASREFRSKVLGELHGLYPIPRCLGKDSFDRFTESLPAIKSAAAEFRHFLPSERRKSFDNALSMYCEHCSKITWESCATFNIVPEMKKPEDEGPKEIFRQHVNALLSFTDKA